MHHAGLVLQRVQAEFLLGYKQLINNDVNSFDDYKEQIAAITVKPVDPPYTYATPWCNEWATARRRTFACFSQHRWLHRPPPLPPLN